jgi:hypothetical protein
MDTSSDNLLAANRTWRTRRVVAVAVAVALTALCAAPAFAQQTGTVSGPENGAANGAANGTETRADTAARGRGALLAVTPVADLDRAEVARFLASNGIDTATVTHGLRAYRLTYRTVTPRGAPTTATGLFALPKGGAHRLDVVADTHGTMASRTYAPSVVEDSGRFSPYLHASAGRAVAAPDYLGLGEGPGLHPYMDTGSSVTATVDLLRAARTAAQRLDRPLTANLYATGFSQGGQVAMALGKALDEGADRHFTLRALAPVSGPYDLVGSEIPAMFDGRVNDVSGVFYLSYFLTAQNRLHPIYKDPAEVFRAPYDKVVESLFDTNHVEEEIIPALPGTVKELFTDAFYQRLRHPTGGLLESLRAQDGRCDWRPAAPVRLYSATGDTDVPLANSRACAADLARNGVKAPVLDQGTVDHGGAFKKAGPEIVRWFDSVQRATAEAGR